MVVMDVRAGNVNIKMSMPKRRINYSSGQDGEIDSNYFSIAIMYYTRHGREMARK
jgi:hypothetical protein